MDKKLARLRERQGRCNHPSWKCLVCEVAQDNIKSEEQKELRELRELVAFYKEKFYNEVDLTLTNLNEENKENNSNTEDYTTIIIEQV